MPGKTTELAHFDLPSVDPDNLEPEKTLDQLEDAILSHGQQIMRSLLEEQWRNLDSILVARHHEAFPPEAVIHEGYSTQRVACRLGIIHLSRQICFNRELAHHLMPGNALLPEHNGTIITRSLQEWACLLPMDLPFATVERLLKWQAQCPEMLCASEVRRLVSAHGEVIREAEAEEVKGLLDRKDLSGEMNSRNSSKPPSSDPDRRKKSGSPGERKPGGQNGHEFATLQPVADPDAKEIIRVDRSSLPDDDYRFVGYESRQVIDIDINRVLNILK